MSMLLRERTKGQSETASDSRSRSHFRAASKTKAAATEVEIRPLTRKAEVINPPNGESEGLRPTRITLDTAEPTVEIQLTDLPTDQPESKVPGPSEVPPCTDGATGDDRPHFGQHVKRMQLLKIRHHVNFLEACIKDDLLPRGMSVHLKVNVMQPNDDLPNEVNRILTVASKAICDLVMKHYVDLFAKYEADLEKTKTMPTDNAQQQEFESKETTFATKLADRRGRKLDALRHPFCQPRADHRQRPARPPKNTFGRKKRQRTTAASSIKTKPDGKISEPPNSTVTGPKTTSTVNTHTRTAHTPTTQAPNDYARTNCLPPFMHTPAPSFPPPPPSIHTPALLPPPSVPLTPLSHHLLSPRSIPHRFF